MMELSIYVDTIIHKFKNAKYYSEIEESEIRFVVEKYLRNEYNDRVVLLNLEIDMANARGEVKDIAFYRTKLTEIKSHIITLTRELGKTSLD